MTAAQENKFLTSTKRDPTFLTKGTYWKEATTAFKEHQASDCHWEATTEALIVLPKHTQGDVGELLSQ